MFAITRIWVGEIRLLFILNIVAFEIFGESLRELLEFHPVYEPLIDLAEFVPLSTQVKNPPDRPEQRPSSYG